MRFRASAAIVAVAVASVTVAGCGGGVSVPIAGPESSSVEAAGSDPMNDAGAENPQAFVFESGILEIGDFDPYTLGDEIFDPCTEITPEEFAAAGFDRVEPLGEEYRGLIPGLSACILGQTNSDDEIVVMNNDASKQYVQEQTSVFDTEASLNLPLTFTYGPKSGIGSACYAQVDTVSGGLVFMVPGLGQETQQVENCRRAVEALESIYLANRNSDVH